MPNYVVKVAPDSDQYIWWSDSTESPYAMGTRAGLLTTMRDAGPYYAREAVPDRFDRADARGTSAMWPTLSDPYLGWADEIGPIFQQRGYVPRSALGAFTAAFLSGDEGAAMVYVQPFEDEVAEVSL